MTAFTERQPILRHKSFSAMQKLSAFAVVALVTGGAEQAYAQAGILVQPNTQATGTIGRNKGDAGSGGVTCPAGQLVTGLMHVDRGSSRGGAIYTGMTTKMGVYCSTISTDGTNVTLQQTTANGTPAAVTQRDYVPSLAPQHGYCGTGRVGGGFGGYDRLAHGNGPWASSLFMYCDTITLSPNDQWFTLSQQNRQELYVGVRENNYPHVYRGTFCNGTELVTGLYAQAGGAGFDGVNVYCGRFLQARHSAALSFTNFAWTKTLGPGGWLVNLTRGTTVLDNGAGISGANKTPYASLSANTAGYNAASEVFVIPNSDYRAAISSRPSGIPAASHIERGNCSTGMTLADKQDASCALEVVGLPDLAPRVAVPTNAFTQYGQAQPVTVTVENRGPGASTANAGFTVQTTVPAGWSASGLPAGCTVAGAVVTCAVTTALEGSSAPGQVGGTTSYSFNLVPNSPVANGTFSLPVRVNADVPNGDSDPTNNDYDLTNNQVTGEVRLLLNARLRLSKVWAEASVNDTARLTATRDSTIAVTLDAVANTANETDMSGFVGLAPSSTYVLAEVLGASNVGAYTASPWVCSGGGSLSGNQLTLATADSGKDITCAITNTRQSADLQITKSANRSSVRSGELITWTITARNIGPNAANGAVLTDTPGAGMDCSVPPPPVCTGANGATCPSNVSAQALASGTVIPVMPTNSSITITLTCRATANGL